MHLKNLCYTAASTLIFGLSTIFSMTMIGCDAEPPAVFDPRQLQQDERTSAPEAPNQQLRPLPTTRQDAFTDIGPNGETTHDGEPYRPTTGPELDTDPIVRMSLHEIIHRAVANNHDVRVAAYTPAIDGARVIEAEAAWDPTFFTNAQWQQKHEQNGGEIFNSFNGTAPFVATDTSTELGTVQTGFQENLDSGGQVQLQYQSTYNWFNPQQTLFNPFWSNDLSLSLTQPLLRNYGYDVNHAQLVIDRLNQKADLLEFRKAVEQNVADIEKAYWELVQATRDIKIQEELVRQTETTYNVLYRRMQDKVDVSPLQVAQAQSQLELRRSQLIQFRSQARDFSDQLKALMSDPQYPVASRVLILPADDPIEDMVEFDLNDQINTAMENRLELGEQQLKVDAALVTIMVAKNNLLPQFDFIGSVGPQGAAADYGTAFRNSFDFSHVDFTVGFKLQVPIGNRAPRAIYQRTILQHMQAIEQYESNIQSVSLDVTTSLRAVNTAWDVIRSSRRSRFAAQDAVTRINAREKTGEPLTPEFVQLKLQLQDTLAQAWENEVLAIANYNIALSQLEKSKGTILKYDNVVLQEDPLHLKNGTIIR
jgi:outer membrane protein TolC